MNILDNLPFQIDTPALVAAMRVRPGSRHETDLLRLIDEARQVARPKAGF